MRIVVVGAGPTGLGAAWRLHELGHDDWTVIEASSTPGGLASSVVDAQGFTWDLGGHVLFSHYAEFDRVMDTLLGDAWEEHVRESWIWMRDRFIPYPLQKNVWRLPPDDLWACIDGLLALPDGARTDWRDFHDWILGHFGQGLSDVFALPYNRKVWAYEPETLDWRWVGERVAPVTLRDVLRGVVYQRDDITWGPNARFRFPRHGGTGAIWSACARRLPQSRLQFGTAVQEVDGRARCVILSDGRRLSYDRLVSTMPLDVLLRACGDRSDLHALAAGLRYSNTNLVGVGMRGQPPDTLAAKNWIYFPEENLPFYRVTVFSNYSPHNVPRPGEQWSLLCEVSESPQRPVDVDRLGEQVIEGLRAARMIADDVVIESLWQTRLERGYPTPFLGRDALLDAIEPALLESGIYSRGRFGGWKYEVSNQDHSFMQGIEVVDHLLHGAAERTWRTPEEVNARPRS